MNTVRVVNVRGMNKPEQRAAVVYVGRPFAGWPGHPLANPFRPTPYGAGGASVNAERRWREAQLANCLSLYRAWLLARPSLDADLAALWEEIGHGAKPLGCWCVNAVAGDGQPVVCHAQIVAEMLAERFAK